MTEPNVKIAKLNGNRYEISVESEYGILKCFVRAKLYGDKAPVDVAKREAETTQLALTRARALAEALNHAQTKSASTSARKSERSRHHEAQPDAHENFDA
jgi:hypothetical protein